MANRACALALPPLDSHIGYRNASVETIICPLRGNLYLKRILELSEDLRDSPPRLLPLEARQAAPDEIELRLVRERACESPIQDLI